MPANPSVSNPMLTTADVASRLSVGGDQVVSLIHAGRLRAVNVSTGRKPRWRIGPADLDVFLAAQSHRPAQPVARRKKLKPVGVTEFF